jgi:hypothetical protein
MAEELPKKRRPSLGTLQAVKAKTLLQAKSYKSLYTTPTELFAMAKAIFGLSEEISQQTAVTHYRLTHYREKQQEIDMVLGDLECVGVIFLFSFGRLEGHFAPFVRIGDAWYNGDNEVGFLRKRADPPSIFMQYQNPSKLQAAHGLIVDSICFYAHPSLITAGRGEQNGTAVFGQTDHTCGPDSLQTVLMFADGLYNYYNQGLYSQLKGLLPARRPADTAELKGNLQAFDKKKYLARLTSQDITPTSRGPIIFILVMLSRYRQIEVLDERAGEQFQVVPNTTKVDLDAYPCQKLRNSVVGNMPSPIHYAVSVNDAELLENLLNCGFDPNKQEKHQSPIFLAVRMGEKELVRILLNYKNPRPEHTDLRGVLNLNFASTVDGVKGTTLLMCACEKISHVENEYEDIIYLLVQHGGYINRKDEWGDTALNFLCMKYTVDNPFILPLVDLLIRNGANVGAKNSDDMGALDYAELRKNQPLIELLQGGDVGEIMDRHGFKGGGGRQTRRHRPNRRL